MTLPVNVRSAVMPLKLCLSPNLHHLPPTPRLAVVTHTQRSMKEHAVDLLTAEGYGHLLDDSKPFYKHMEDVRALPENILFKLYEVDKANVGSAGM